MEPTNETTMPTGEETPVETPATEEGTTETPSQEGAM